MKKRIASVFDDEATCWPYGYALVFPHKDGGSWAYMNRTTSKLVARVGAARDTVWLALKNRMLPQEVYIFARKPCETAA